MSGEKIRMRMDEFNEKLREEGRCLIKHGSEEHDQYIEENEKKKKEKKVDGGGKRMNNNKIRVGLVPPSLVYAVANVFEAGLVKYEADNWRRGMNWSTVLESMERHLLKFKNNEDIDSETLQNHISHIAANCAILLEYLETCPELDDRYKGPTNDYKNFKDEK